MTKWGVPQCSKPCLQCGKEFGPQDIGCPSSFPRQKYCGNSCSFEARKYTNESRTAAFWEGFERLPWSGCWIWTLSTFHAGYGCFHWPTGPNGERRLTGIHRIAYLLTKGPIPKGMEVMHICDVRTCGNPDHLKLGTHHENILDAKAKGRNFNVGLWQASQQKRAA